MKVHITLIGGQPAPIYYTIKALSPDYIVYIHSDRTQEELNIIKQELDIPSEQISLSPTDPKKIKDKADELATRFATDQVTLNISGGIKSWTYWFSIIFNNQENATVVYIDQNNNLWDYRTMQSIEVKNFDILAHFRLHNNPIDGNYTDYKEYTPLDKAAAETIEEIRHSNHEEFKELTTVLTKEQNNQLRKYFYGKFVCQSSAQSYIKWKKPNKQGGNGKIEIALTNKAGTIQKWSLSSPHITDLIFNSGWFEYKVASIISQWNKAKEIFLNCHFPFKPGTDKNEVDILVNTGKKALFVECKTQINSTTDIDKFSAVIKKYGGIGSKGIFITNSAMKELAIKKCEESKILHFSLEGANKVLSTEKALATLLDIEIDNINAK